MEGVADSARLDGGMQSLMNSCVGILYGAVFWAQQRDNEGSGSAPEKYASGRSIRKAQEELDTLARFEQE